MPFEFIGHMSFLDIFTKVSAGLVSPVTTYLQRRAEIKSQEHIRTMELEAAIHQSRLALVSKNLDADSNWESLQIQNSGWKDEWVLLLLSVPLVLVFVPFYASYILAGFGILEKTPDWYRWLVLLVFTAIYGIRIWRRKGTDA